MTRILIVNRFGTNKGDAAILLACVVRVFETVERPEVMDSSRVLSWLQGGSRVTEREEPGCGKPEPGMIRLTTRLGNWRMASSPGEILKEILALTKSSGTPRTKERVDISAHPSGGLTVSVYCCLAGFMNAKYAKTPATATALMP